VIFRIMEDIRNHLEIRVCGLMRSGNHAIIEWIMAQFTGKRVAFLNNLRFGDRDPYKNVFEKVFHGFSSNEPEEIRLLPKDVLIYSYEDNDELEKNGKSFSGCVFDPEFEANKDKYLGKSGKFIDIVILRDPFNMFASRLELMKKKPHDHGGVSNSGIIVQNWIDLARLVLKWQAESSPSRLVILYNRWSKDQVYRRLISEFLGGEFCDETMTKVSAFGGGSSFEDRSLVKLTLTGIFSQFWKVFRPSSYKNLSFYWKRFWLQDPQKKVMERWKSYEKDAVYCRMVSNPEVLLLCSNVFGSIPGTEKFQTMQLEKNPFGKQ